MTIALAFMSKGLMMLNQGSGAEAYPPLKTSLELFQELNVGFFTTNSMIHLANASLASNDFPGARAYLERAIQVAETVGDEWLTATGPGTSARHPIRLQSIVLLVKDHETRLGVAMDIALAQRKE